MNKKIYTCKQCGNYLSGQRRKFCNTDCNKLWSRDQLKMDYGDGRCHNPMSRFGEDGSIEAVHVPYNVLQEAKNIFDLTNEKHIVEDPETVNNAMRSLKRNTPDHIYNAKSLNRIRWKKQQIEQKGYWQNMTSEWQKKNKC